MASSIVSATEEIWHDNIQSAVLGLDFYPLLSYFVSIC